jgi:hypothetical protein
MEVLFSGEVMFVSDMDILEKFTEEKDKTARLTELQYNKLHTEVLFSEEVLFITEIDML